MTLTLSRAGLADDLYCLLTLSRVIITARQCSGGRGAPRQLDGVGDGPGPGTGDGDGGRAPGGAGVGVVGDEVGALLVLAGAGDVGEVGDVVGVVASVGEVVGAVVVGAVVLLGCTSVRGTQV